MWRRKQFLFISNVYVRRATHVDATDVAANIAGVIKKLNRPFSRSTLTALAEAAHPSWRVHKVQVGSSKWHSTCLHAALYIPTYMIICFLSILFKLQKEKKEMKRRRKKRMHCVARVSIKIKAIFRAHRSFSYCDWSSLMDSEWVIIHWYEKWLLDGRNRGTRVWRVGWLLFLQGNEQRIVQSFVIFFPFLTESTLSLFLFG